MRWAVFCRVVDNYGDVGFGWRLAAALAARGEVVRLLLDDRSALGWMAPDGAPGVEVTGWSDAGAAAAGADVVVETFGCGVPDAALHAMAARATRATWIDVEYLSAEPYVERSHGLPSPQQAGAAAGLTRWFFYPGFTPSTGGLLREADLATRQRAFSRADWLERHGVGGGSEAAGAAPRGGPGGSAPDRSAAAGAEAPCRIVSLFCYDGAPVDALLDRLAERPTRLLVAAGRTARRVTAALGPGLVRGALRAHLLPRLSQLDYDHLLWSCDLNVVRGEDSFVRAQWASVPFLWQAYPQSDDAQDRKVEAFVDRFVADAPAALAASLRAAFGAWNGRGAMPAAWPSSTAWRTLTRRWRAGLLAQPDLVSRLIGFAIERR